MNTCWNLGKPPATSEEEPPAPLRFERRNVDRWPTDGAASAIRVAGEKFGEIVDLKLLDYSHYGLGALGNGPLEPGAIISVGFQSPGHTARRGVVVRCQPCGEGYRIAVRFEHRLAA